MRRDRKLQSLRRSIRNISEGPTYIRFGPNSDEPMAFNPCFHKPPLADCPIDGPHLPPIRSGRGHPEYHINNLVDVRFIKGVLKYRVRWLTYGEADDTWETRQDLEECAALDRWEEYQIIVSRALADSHHCITLMPKTSQSANSADAWQTPSRARRMMCRKLSPTRAMRCLG